MFSEKRMKKFQQVRSLLHESNFALKGSANTELFTDVFCSLYETSIVIIDLNT